MNRKLIIFRCLAGMSVILLIALIGSSTGRASASMLAAQPASSIVFVSKSEGGGATITCSDYYNGQRCSFNIPAAGSDLFHGVQALFDWSGPASTVYFVIDATATGTFWYDGPAIDINGWGYFIPGGYWSTGSTPATGVGFRQWTGSTDEWITFNPYIDIQAHGGTPSGTSGIFSGVFYVMPQPVLPTPTPTPSYDCSGTELSPIAQAVLWEVQVEQQGYCGNSYQGLITLPPGEQAFENFGTLARDAQYEVDFTTMIWDENVGLEDGAGRIFLSGIKELYDSVQDPIGHGKSADYYSRGVQVRILVGLTVYPLDRFGPDRLQDQRVRIMEDIVAKDIEFADTNWNVEVAVYRNGLAQGIHSHSKLMIIDGKTAISGGYNMQYAYLNGGTRRDMGIEVSGPIAFNALDSFDELWAGAYICTQVDGLNCIQNSVATLTRHEELDVSPSPVGNDVVFSLFRTSDLNQKSSDAAIVAAIEAASNNVKIFQKSFMDTSFWNPPQYARAILNVLQKANAQVNVKLLVSGGSPEDLLTNIPGICMLEAQLISEEPSRFYLLEARRSTSANPIHTKALSVDDTFLIVGSQNFDLSAWGNDPTDWPWGDLAEYSLGVDSAAAAAEFNYGSTVGETDGTFFKEWNDSSPLSCLNILIPNFSLQDEIDDASPGTAIFIPEGVYAESVTINKPLVLIGAGASQSIIQPEGNQPAFRITSSDVVISNMKINGGGGYGIELMDSSPSSLRNIQINRVVFENNAQGGIWAQGLIPGSPMNYSIENNTFIGGADGITVNMLETQAETSVVRNNIFSGQSNAPVHILSTNDSRVEYSYNLFDDCGLGACVTNWTQGNLSTVSSSHDNLFDLAPIFASPENGAYQLSAGSPAIDAGDPELLHDLFFDGDGDGFIRIDIGAFEYAPVANVAPVVDAGVDQTVEVAHPVSITATYTDADNSENHTARIDWGDGVVEDVPVNMTGPGAGEVTGGHTYSNAGNYTVEVCVTDLYGSVGCDTMNVEVTSSGSAEIHIGETYVLNNDDSGNGNYLLAQRVTVSQEATIQSLSFYVTQAAGDLRLGVYDDANGDPDSLVAETDAFTPVVGWNTQSVQTPVLLPAGTYWLAYLPESNNLHFRVSPWTGTDSARYYSHAYGEMSSTFSSSASSGEFQFSFYATFTVDAPAGTLYAGEFDILNMTHDGLEDTIVGQAVEITETAVIESLSVYINNAEGDLRLGIYTDYWDGPGTLLAQTDAFTPTEGWNTQEVLSPITLLPGTYWLAFLPENPDLEFRYEWIPGQYTGRFDDEPYGEMPFVYNPYPIGVEYHFSLYATLMQGDASVFPNTSLLDDFNRADGAIGSDWSGETTEFSIASNALTANSDISMIGWNGESFGADQEAYVTLTNVDTGEGNEHGLILKSQSAGTPDDGAIEVAYDGANERVLVWTFTPGQGWILWGDDIPVTFVDGDVLGARAFPNGWVEIYKNEALIGRRNLSAWEFSSSGGYIGMLFYHAWDAVGDDFGGGTVSGGEAMMMSGNSLQGSPSVGEPEFVVSTTELNLKANANSSILQGMPSNVGPRPYVILPLPNASEKKYLTEKPQEIEKPDLLKVVYDVAGGRIQIWMYAAQAGKEWVQYGKDIRVKFVEGDTFTASINIKGMLEIHRNGELFATVDVTP